MDLTGLELSYSEGATVDKLLAPSLCPYHDKASPLARALRLADNHFQRQSLRLISTVP